MNISHYFLSIYSKNNRGPHRMHVNNRVELGSFQERSEKNMDFGFIFSITYHIYNPPNFQYFLKFHVCCIMTI